MAGAVRPAEANESWVALMLEGLTGITTAIITMAWQEITALSLIYILASWALVSGVFEIVAALCLRKHIAGEWLLALSGVASLVLGILMIAIPIAGTLPIAFWIAVYAFVFGTLLIALGFRLRSWARMSGDARYGAVDWQVWPSL